MPSAAVVCILALTCITMSGVVLMSQLQWETQMSVEKGTGRALQSGTPNFVTKSR